MGICMCDVDVVEGVVVGVIIRGVRFSSKRIR